jgi:hypothetical protein
MEDARCCAWLVTRRPGGLGYRRDAVGARKFAPQPARARCFSRGEQSNTDNESRLGRTESGQWVVAALWNVAVPSLLAISTVEQVTDC